MPTDTNALAERIRNLVEKHRSVDRNGKLLFAGWFDRSNLQGDVCLFEVFEQFPDSGIGRLDTYLFPSSQDFPMTGSLRLTVTSPTELREASANSDPTLEAVRSSTDREVIYPESEDWDKFIESLLK